MVNMMIKTINDTFSNYVVMYKVGAFYQVYNKGAIICSYLFGYMIKQINEQNIVGFPKGSLNKVCSILEQKGVNYLLVDKLHNYEEEDKYDFKNLNNFDIVYDRSYKYVTLKNRSNNIHTYLINNIENGLTYQIINRVEDIINEKRKVCTH